jgi:hypothetical protein
MNSASSTGTGRGVGASPAIECTVRFARLEGNAGAEIVEAALVLPVLFLLLFSIFWFGRAFSISGSINHAAREGARVAAVPACASCSPTPATCLWPGSMLPCDQTVVDTVNNALIAAHVDSAIARPYSPNPAPQACPGAVPQGVCVVAGGTAPTHEINICRNVVLNGSTSPPSPPVCGVIVSFQYAYPLTRPFSSQTIDLKAQVEMRGED